MQKDVLVPSDRASVEGINPKGNNASICVSCIRQFCSPGISRKICELSCQRK